MSQENNINWSLPPDNTSRFILINEDVLAEFFIYPTKIISCTPCACPFINCPLFLTSIQTIDKP